MATQHGRLREFHPESDSVKAYLERTTLYFTANDVPDDKQAAVLLSTIGAPTYALLSDLVAPDAPSRKSFAEIGTALCAHYEPKRVVIAERFHFHKRDQTPGESISDFDAALRKLAMHCKFAAALDDTLRDRFVCGLRHEAIQRRLLSEKDLTHTKAMEIARAMEAADSNAKSFKAAEPAIRKFTSQQQRTGNPPTACYRCGRSSHQPADCKFREATCNQCGKKGHISPVCRSKAKSPQASKPPAQSYGGQHRRGRGSNRRTHQVQEDPVESGTEASSDEEYRLHKLTERSSDPITVTVTIDGKQLPMELDTGAAVSIISDKTRRSLFPDLELRESALVLKTYTDELMEVVGQLRVRVKYGSQEQKLILVVVAGSGPSLFGRNWLKYLRLDWSRIASVRTTRPTSLDSLLTANQQLFANELGTVTPFKAQLLVQPQANPRFCKPRTVPFAIRAAVGKELDLLEEQGIIEKVSHSDWAAPIVPVPKKDGRFRICGDYKVTVNQVLSVEQYPLPKPDELFATLAGGKCFSKLDLSQAYLQVLLEEESRPYVTVNTHQGLYRYTRLPFGVASAPALFQKLMDQVLHGIPGVACYIDDILISTTDEESHIKTLEEVFRRLKKHGFRLKKEKCEFLTASVEYLGHLIDQDGIRPLPSKVTAIVKAPAPTNLQELRSFLGLLNYYGKFIPNLSTLIHPLNQLLQADRKWSWTEECAKAFECAKTQLTSSNLLTHYDPSLPIQMAADASAYGVGAVISHRFPDGSERPIAFASRTLSSSEKNYAQLEKEALSLVFGVKKFHHYLYGRKFTLITDHKPLTTILGPKTGIPSLAAARLQRWALLLSAYEYEIRYKSTRDHCNADGLSRLPLPSVHHPTSREDSVFNIAQAQALPVTVRDIQKATRQDVALGKVFTYVQQGWPQQVPDALRPFKTRQNELGTENGCLMWGIRVLIPTKLQAKVLKSLHENHPGITRMKAIARSYFWWSGLDKAIEDLAKSCSVCQSLQATPAAAPLHPWVWPDSPWKRIHVDFAGPFQGKMFFILVDAHSKWPEVITMPSTTSQATIEALRSVFSRFGLPDQLASDNGPQFTSEEFALFLKQNGIKHIRSAPYHPSSNGLAERFVQTFKRAMRAGEKDGLPLTLRLSEFLFSYRATPHATTDVSPGELFLKRKLRTRFDLLKPDHPGLVASRQTAQKTSHDGHARLRSFLIDSSVMVRDYRHPTKWVPGVIVRKLGPVTYHVDLGGGNVVKRHIDQLTHRQEHSPVSLSADTTPAVVADNWQYPATPEDPEREPPELPQQPPQPRYPQRVRQPPDRLQAVSADGTFPFSGEEL